MLFATREASKEMIGTDLAASPLMPGNGRAYLLVGTGSRFEYFQSAYSGADIFDSDEIPVVLTLAKRTGDYEIFYDSKDQLKIDENRENAKNQNDGKSQDASKAIDKSSVQQIKFMCDVLRDDIWDNGLKDKVGEPRQVFIKPLPTKCWYDYSEGRYKVISQEVKKKE